MLLPGYFRTHKDPQVSDPRVNNVDDHLAVALDLIHRLVNLVDPVKCLLRRRDVITLGGEDNNRIFKILEVYPSVLIKPQLALFEFIAELDDIQGDDQTPQAILFTALRLPNLAFEMLPVAVLIGSLLGLGALAGHSEIIVMRSAGLSVMRLAGMVAVSGLVLLILTGLIGEFIGPPLDFYARNMRTEARYQKDEERLGTATWVKDGDAYLHLERVSPEFEFGTIYIYRFNENNQLASIAQAENSGIDDEDYWVLERLRETKFRDDGVQVVESSLAVEVARRLGIGRVLSTDSIRDVMAFPKTQTAACPLTSAPSAVSAEQLRDLGLRLRKSETEKPAG